MTDNVFKNTYVIDMAKIRTIPVIYTPNVVELPLETGFTNPARLFSERHVKHMIEQYPVLFPVIGKKANTIIDYVSNDGRPLITIYPNIADIDIHDKDFEQLLNRTALEDLNTTIKEHKNYIQGLRGALHEYSKK